MAHFLTLCVKKPGFSLQFLKAASRLLRDFRFNPGCMDEQQSQRDCDQSLAPHGLLALRAI
ncbi:MAG: hypothetical protein LBC67_06675 [Spirochaetales bacterium]|nr:hypothetical protein [Spirochaetales bacterium]